MKDGGSAFPIFNERGISYFGMTLRDYFAGQALALALGEANFSDGEPVTSKEMAELLAKDAYLIADAMLKEKDT